MQLTGRCHCGNIAFALRFDPDPERIPARACDCSFCGKHGGVWTTSPGGSLWVRSADPERVSHYRFGTGTADFHVCTSCGVVPIVTSDIEGRLYAVVSVNALEGVEEKMLERAPASFGSESPDARLARRKRSWIANVQFE